MQVYGVSKEDAIHMMERRTGAENHSITARKMGDSRNYDFPSTGLE